MTTHLRSQTPDKGPDGILASGMKFLKGMGLVGAGVYSICMTGVVSDAIEAASSKPTAVLDTPAKVMMAERVVGIWDGLEDPDVVSRAEHRLLTRILMDRDPDVVNALLPIYQEAYQATLQGDYDYEDLQSYLDVIQMEKATLQDVVKQVTETFHDVAKDEPIVAMITHDLDTIDAKIYEAMQGVRAMADSISGPGPGSLFSISS